MSGETILSITDFGVLTGIVFALLTPVYAVIWDTVRKVGKVDKRLTIIETQHNSYHNYKMFGDK